MEEAGMHTVAVCLRTNRATTGIVDQSQIQE